MQVRFQIPQMKLKGSVLKGVPAFAWSLVALTLAFNAAFAQSSWPTYPNNTVISVTSGGYVGIGNAAPAGPFDVGNSFYTSTGTIWVRPQNANLEGGEIRLLGAGSNSTIYWDNWSSNARIFWGDTANHQLQVFNAGGGTTGLYVQGSVGIGTSSPQYTLSVNGTVGAKDIIVTSTGWPDYVFDRGYQLRPLSEVDKYIRNNHHLPGVPSEKEVAGDGLHVGVMQAKLLEKIEELTLYMIKQERENQVLRERLEKLEGVSGSRSSSLDPAPGHNSSRR